MKKMSNVSVFLGLVFFMLLMMPCMSAASEYFFEDASGTYDHSKDVKDGAKVVAVSATINYIKDGINPNDFLTVTLNTDKTFSLTGKINNVQVGLISGTYTVVIHDNDFGRFDISFINSTTVNGVISFNFDQSYTLYDGFARVDTVVPVPAAGWLLGTGLVSLVGIRRKFRK